MLISREDRAPNSKLKVPHTSSRLLSSFRILESTDFSKEILSYHSPRHISQPILLIVTMCGLTSTQPAALPAEATDREASLEKSGDINSLQRYRLHHFLLEMGEMGEDKRYDPLLELLSIEQELRETVQMEISLKENVREKMTGESPEEHTHLHKQIYLLERDWWQAHDECLEGVLMRGFELWRSHPRWYMHETLVTDCARKGGCCGRNCGCCDRDSDSHYKFGVGHCTVECGCCRKHRGFDLTVEEKDEYKTKLPHGSSYNPYWNRIYLAAIWGLCIGRDDNPFDMIQPRKEHTCSSKPNDTLFNVDDESDSSFAEVPYI